MSLVRSALFRAAAVASTVILATGLAGPAGSSPLHSRPPSGSSDWGSTSWPAPGREPNQSFNAAFHFFTDHTVEDYTVTMKTAFSNCV